MYGKLSPNNSAGYIECISEILSTIQSSHSWLYPTKSHGKHETELSSAVLKDVINDNLLTTEISATQGGPNDSSSKTKTVWPAYLLYKSPQMIDEFYGSPYQCAYESFCPDPCCHGIHSSSPLLFSQKCALNKCLHKDRCHIEAAFNDDFTAMRVNKWNITCPCGKGLMYRPDIESCVHSDLCSEHQRCPATFDCVNTIADPGYKCICQLGYMKNDLGQCVPIGISSSAWHGFAYSGPVSLSSYHQTCEVDRKESFLGHLLHWIFEIGVLHVECPLLDATLAAVLYIADFFHSLTKIADLT
ncbi:hypothetical protein RB195_000886 [Necator americanus]|uniref:EGF-like domain-containing protein n=1 Tax=Necator americanus TaxID=51031 RepID=A0ABR1DBT2_NECAM